MTIINLTPHAVTVRLGEKTIEFPPSGQIARVGVEYAPAGEVAGIPVVRATIGAVEGLPDPAEGVLYIVSAMVAQALPNRHDLIAPDTGAGAVRDEAGRIVAVTRFVRYDVPEPPAPPAPPKPPAGAPPAAPKPPAPQVRVRRTGAPVRAQSFDAPIVAEAARTLSALAEGEEAEMDAPAARIAIERRWAELVSPTPNGRAKVYIAAPARVRVRVNGQDWPVLPRQFTADTLEVTAPAAGRFPVSHKVDLKAGGEYLVYSTPVRGDVGNVRVEGGDLVWQYGDHHGGLLVVIVENPSQRVIVRWDEGWRGKYYGEQRAEWEKGAK